jgi:hypothetical protein
MAAAPPSDPSQSNGASTHEVGFPLGRRKSTGSTEPSGRGRASLIGLPLTLTRSAQRGGATAPVRKQRMLNGRVYGARHNPSPVRPRKSPCSSNGVSAAWAQSTSSGGSQYARLAESNKLSLGTEASTADEDDGSGMAWVAKRRAAREEKARKEKEAALEAERAKQVCLCLFCVFRCPIQISSDLQASKEEEPATAPEPPMRLTRSRSKLKTSKCDRKPLHLPRISPLDAFPHLAGLQMAGLPMPQVHHPPPLRLTTRSTTPSRPSAFLVLHPRPSSCLATRVSPR